MVSQTRVALNAHLLSGQATYRSAGIHGYLFNTLAHLPEVDLSFAYTVFVGNGQLPERADWAVQRSRLPTHNPLVRIVWEQVVAPLALARLRPHLLHGMAFSLPVMWAGPSVVTIYDLSFLRYPRRLSASRRLYLRLITQFSARRARRVIAISQSGKAEISALLGIPQTRIDVAVPGVGQNFHPLPTAEIDRFRAHQQLPERFILYVGTLEPRKNLDTLIRAYAKLSHRDRVKLVLVGGRGWQVRPLLALVEGLNLTQDILLPGFVDNVDLPLWYNAAEIFVYPSLYEGFGLPLLEAMACGVPVVASDTTSLPEAVGQEGILLPPTSADAWADALANLLENQTARRDLAARGQERARQFTWTETARKTVAAYRQALGNEG